MMSNVENIVMAIIAVHNYLRQTDTANYFPNGFFDSKSSTEKIVSEHWCREVNDSISTTVDGITTIPTLRGSCHSNEAICMQDKIAL